MLSGEIEECEHVKSMLGQLARSSFAASFGVNDDFSAALAVTAIVELILIIATLAVKVTISSCSIFVKSSFGVSSAEKPHSNFDLCFLLDWKITLPQHIL